MTDVLNGTSQVVFSSHAQRRCSEMGLTSSVVKQIIANPSSTSPGHRTSWGSPTTLYISEVDPRFVVCTTVNDRGETLVVTILFNSPEEYVRDGNGYILASTGERIDCTTEHARIRTNPQGIAAMRSVYEAASRKVLVDEKKIQLELPSASLEVLAEALSAQAEVLHALAVEGWSVCAVEGTELTLVRRT